MPCFVSPESSQTHQSVPSSISLPIELGLRGFLGRGKAFFSKLPMTLEERSRIVQRPKFLGRNLPFDRNGALEVGRISRPHLNKHDEGVGTLVGV
jgi:hypothetical protein